LSPTQRSVLAGLQLQAHRFDSVIEAKDFRPENGSIGSVYMFERRIGRLTTGILDGVAIIRSGEPASERVRPETLAEVLGNRSVATLQILGPERPAEPGSPARSKRAGLQAPLDPFLVQEVMPLEASYDDLLRRLGKHTRRNIIQCRKWAADQAIKFHSSAAAGSLDYAALCELTKQNMPEPKNLAKLLKTVEFAASRGQQFQVALRSREKPFSVAGGFIEGDMALMVYQLNARTHRTLNPSLMLRGFLLEHLIERGVRYLAFVGGCAGVLQHQCMAVSAAELVLVRNKISGHITHRLGAILADTTSRLVRLAPRFIVLTAALLPCYFN
jgi:hypothetical protein